MPAPPRGRPPGAPRPPPDRALGQHFLSDPTIVGQIVAAAGVGTGAVVVDVGAGRGIIGGKLADVVAPTGRVVAIEFDEALIPGLKRAAAPVMEVVHGDALQVPWPKHVHAIVANPPFKILSPLLYRAWDERVGRVVVVEPREVSRRVVARVGSPDYGRLTVDLALRYDHRVLFNVPAWAYEPAPDTPTSVIRFDPKPLPKGVTGPGLRAVLDHAWASKERTLRRGLAGLAPELRISSEVVSDVLRDAGLEDRPALEVSPDGFAVVARAVSTALAAKQG